MRTILPVTALAVLALASTTACSSSDPKATNEATSHATAALSPLTAITWTGLVNASVVNGALTKTGGQPQVEDAGGVSQQSVASGDGAFQFTVSETSTFRFVGIGHQSTYGGAATIDFAFRLQSGRADIYENGAYRADNLGATGDVLAITVSGGTVTYSKNGTVVYTSAKGPTYPLVAQASLIDPNATIASAEITQPGAGAAVGHAFCGWIMSNGSDPTQDPGYTGFAAHAASFDAVHPIWHGTTGVTTFHDILGRGSSLVLDNTTYGGKPTKLEPTVAQVDNPNELVSGILNNASERAQHEAALVNLAVSNRYDGLDIDYEHLPATDQAVFTTFVQELASQLHAQGKELTVDVQGVQSTSGTFYNLPQLAAAADHLHVMGYDYHGLGTHAGPIAPLGWVKSVLQYIDTTGLQSKFVLGMPNYAIGGPAGSSNQTNWSSTSLDAITNQCQGSYQTTAAEMATATSCPFTNGVFVDAGRAPNCTSSVGAVYFEDLASMEEKVAAAKAAGLGGMTYFTIGGEPDRPGTRTFFEMVRSYYPAQ